MTDTSISPDSAENPARAERAIHYDILDKRTWDSWLQTASSVREQHRVSWSDTYGGFWNLTGFDEVFSASLDAETFSSEFGASPIQFDLKTSRMIPLELDDPKHRQIRTKLWPFFAPAAVRATEDSIREIVDDLMRECLEHGQPDMIPAFAWKIPSRVFSSLFLREEDPETLKWLHQNIDDMLAFPMVASEKAIPELVAWCSEALEQHRRSNDRESLIGTIAHLGYQGDLVLSDRERSETLFLIVISGMETTANMLGHICHIMATDHALREELRGSNRETFHRAVHEVMRSHSGVVAASRTLTKDIEMDGCPMKQGDRVYLHWAAANQDPEMFPNPERIDLNRPNRAKHVAFGAGVHRCLGAHLAEAELRIAMEAICDVEDYELVPGADIRYRGGLNWGPRAVPVIIS